MAFHPINRNMDYLLPPSVQEWLPESHLARYVVDVVEGLDLSEMERKYAGRGSDAYHPATLLSLLIYAYATGTFSSRKIERATYDSLAFRYIACNRHPDHDTLANFRKRFEREKAEYDARMAARAAKEAKTGKKPKGRQPKAPDATPCAKDQVNLTDDESRIMKVAGGGFEQCYNAQAVVDTESMLVMVPVVTDAVNDKEQVVPMVARVQALPTGLNRPGNILIDNGYFSEKNVIACESAGIPPLIAAGRESHHPEWRERFTEAEPLPPDATPLEKMKHRLKTKAGRALYALRKQTVEPVFGIIKSVMGFRQFLMRGLDNVQIEWTLVCLAWNLKRMAVLRPQ